MTPLRSIEVCFSPRLFKHTRTEEECTIVVTDILRATTSMCTALENGALDILPVATLHDAEHFKKQGFLVAAERNGLKVDFADFGNSPFDFRTPVIKRKTLVYTTTNGTRAIEMAREKGQVVLGSFINRKILSRWIVKQKKPVIILCAGWKNQFNLEDALFCGALIESLLDTGKYAIDCDSAHASLDLWSLAKADIIRYIDKASHLKRLRALGVDDVVQYTFTPDTSQIVPVMKGDRIVSA